MYIHFSCVSPSIQMIVYFQHTATQTGTDDRIIFQQASQMSKSISNLEPLTMNLFYF